MSPLASCSLLWLVTGFCCCRNFCCVWLGSTPPPFRGLGNITSSTILSCTVICSRQNPRLYCTVLCRAQYSPVLYSADRNCKATFVFPFRDSTKMPLSRLPREIDIFSCQRRRRESNNQRRTDWLFHFWSSPKLIYHQKKTDCWHDLSRFESNDRRSEFLAECKTRAYEREKQSLTFFS